MKKLLGSIACMVLGMLAVSCEKGKSEEMKMRSYRVKGDIIYTAESDKFETAENSYLEVKDGKIVGIYTNNEGYTGKVLDYSGKLVMPGFVDTHIHAPQINNIGLGYDKELLPWLETYTFPEEAKFKNKEYAKKSYTEFIERLKKNGVTSSVIFASLYKDSSIDLANMLEEAGLRSYVGLVCMDRNSPDFYMKSTEENIKDTEEFVQAVLPLKTVQPIITPRFVPSCTPELMKALGEIAKKYNLKVQSHLSENRSEITWVKELHPDCPNYLSVYEKYGLIRPNCSTVMAHCVHLTEEEKQEMVKKSVLVSHCPYSNGCLASGIAPIAEMVRRGMKISLGSDVSGGNEMFMGRVMALAAIFSKMNFVHINNKDAILTAPNLFYMATKGGGEFFGKVGSFEKDYAADFLVVDDSSLTDQNKRSLVERTERFFYTGESSNIEAVFVAGKQI